MKKFLPMVIVAVVFGGLGVGAAGFLKKPAASASEEGPKAPVAEKVQITLDDFIANLSDTDEQHYLRSTVVLEIRGGPETEAGMKKMTPKIRDLILTLMGRRSMSELQTPQGKQSLKGAIKKGVNDMMGDDLVASVYFTSFAMQ